MTPKISIVIPTRGRPAQLSRTLCSYATLAALSPDFEIIVVLDGEDEESRAVVLNTSLPVPLFLYEQSHHGIGPARNLGTDRAHAPLVIFLNDDTTIAPNCLSAHLKAQETYGPCLVLGRVDWNLEEDVTEYMRWLAPTGHQFNFSRLPIHKEVCWDACWGTNLSVPRSWVIEEPFDPLFPYPAMEDGEWGYRVTRKGRKIVYAPEAVCYHHHTYRGPADYRTRPLMAGAASRYFVRRHPELVWKILLRPVFAALGATVLMPFRFIHPVHALWDLDFRWSFVIGLLSGQNSRRYPWLVDKTQP